MARLYVVASGTGYALSAVGPAVLWIVADGLGGYKLAPVGTGVEALAIVSDGAGHRFEPLVKVEFAGTIQQLVLDADLSFASLDRQISFAGTIQQLVLSGSLDIDWTVYTGEIQQLVLAAELEHVQPTWPVEFGGTIQQLVLDVDVEVLDPVYPVEFGGTIQQLSLQASAQFYIPVRRVAFGGTIQQLVLDVDVDFTGPLNTGSFRLYLDTSSGSVIPTIGPHPTFSRASGASSVDMGGRAFTSLPNTPRYSWVKPYQHVPLYPPSRRAALRLESAKVVLGSSQALETLQYPIAAAVGGRVGLYLRFMLDSLPTGSGWLASLGEPPALPYFMLHMNSANSVSLSTHNGVTSDTLSLAVPQVLAGQEVEVLGVAEAAGYALSVSIAAGPVAYTFRGPLSGGLPAAYASGLKLNGPTLPIDARWLEIKEADPDEFLKAGADRLNEIRMATLGPTGDLVYSG